MDSSDFVNAFTQYKCGNLIKPLPDETTLDRLLRMSEHAGMCEVCNS